MVLTPLRQVKSFVDDSDDQSGEPLCSAPTNPCRIKVQCSDRSGAKGEEQKELRQDRSHEEGGKRQKEKKGLIPKESDMGDISSWPPLDDLLSSGPLPTPSIWVDTAEQTNHVIYPRVTVRVNQ